MTSWIKNEVYLEKLEKPYRIAYMKMKLYIHLNGIENRKNEDVHNDLLEMLFHAQMQGTSIEETIGNDPILFCDNLISETKAPFSFKVDVQARIACCMFVALCMVECINNVFSLSVLNSNLISVIGFTTIIVTYLIYANIIRKVSKMILFKVELFTPVVYSFLLVVGVLMLCLAYILIPWDMKYTMNRMQLFCLFMGITILINIIFRKEIYLHQKGINTQDSKRIEIILNKWKEDFKMYLVVCNRNQEEVKTNIYLEEHYTKDRKKTIGVSLFVMTIYFVVTFSMSTYLTEIQGIILGVFHYWILRSFYQNYQLKQHVYNKIKGMDKCILEISKEDIVANVE